MAIIPQTPLFSWEEIEQLGDLDRLRLVVEYLPDEALMAKLEAARGHGRDDHPVRAIWNSVLAGVVFQHPSIESLRRELGRNGQLRHLCGLHGVPSAAAYTRFLQAVVQQYEEIDAMFERMVEELETLLPGFGKHAGIDGKALASFARGKAKSALPDGRRDTDGDYGTKTYKGQRKDGTAWEKIVHWFGYRLHLVVDTVYELPLAFTVTKASTADLSGGKALLQQMDLRQHWLLDRMESLAADKGYDDTDLTVTLFERYGIKPVIDIRHSWKDGETSRLLPGHTNATYDLHGNVDCYEPETGARHRMSNGGFEKDRMTLKKLCPARHGGIACPAVDTCPLAKGLRVPLAIDRRIFTPIDRSGYAWKRLYKGRTAVERVNSRLDVSFGFELHTIRGLAKMKLRVGLALCVMLAMAIGHIRENQPGKIRSLVA